MALGRSKEENETFVEMLFAILKKSVKTKLIGAA